MGCGRALSDSADAKAGKCSFEMISGWLNRLSSLIGCDSYLLYLLTLIVFAIVITQSRPHSSVAELHSKK